MRTSFSDRPHEAIAASFNGYHKLCLAVVTAILMHGQTSHTLQCINVTTIPLNKKKGRKYLLGRHTGKFVVRGYATLSSLASVRCIK